MIALIGVDVRQRQVGPRILRRDPQGRLQEPDLRRRLLGNQALDVILEGAERHRAGRGRRRRHRAAGGRLAAHQAAGHAVVEREQLGQRRPIGRLLDEPPGVEPDAPGVDDQFLAAQAHGADDQIARQHQVSDPDQAGQRQPAGGRQVGFLEGVHALGARQRRQLHRPQRVAQEHRGGFAEPHRTRIAIGDLERHDQHPRRARRRLRRWAAARSAPGRSPGGATEEREREHRLASAGHPAVSPNVSPGCQVTTSTQTLPPVARHFSRRTAAARP